MKFAKSPLKTGVFWFLTLLCVAVAVGCAGNNAQAALEITLAQNGAAQLPIVI